MTERLPFFPAVSLRLRERNLGLGGDATARWIKQDCGKLPRRHIWIYAMASTTVEDYVKAIFLAQQELAEGEAVPMGQVARALGVVPGTATTMVKSLAQSEYLVYEPRRGVRVTDSGRELALRVLRRHRIVELFLVETLGLDWSEIHEEADRLEHAISDRVLDKLDAFLGSPTVDPHGDPIPTACGELDERRLETLADCPVRIDYRVARIGDQSDQFLQYAESEGLKPGADVLVQSREPLADSVTLRLAEDRRLTLGMTAAAKIFVE